MELVIQQEKNDCGPANCVMIINHLLKQEINLTEFKVKHNYKGEEYSLYDIKKELFKYEIESDFYEYNNLNELNDIPTPFLMVIKNEEGLNHYVLITEKNNNFFEIYDPSKISSYKLNISELEKISLRYVGVFKYFRGNKICKDKIYWKTISKLFKINWKNYFLINCLNFLSVFSFLLTNMFVRVLLSEYLYLTNKRLIIIFSIFLILLSFWFLINKLINLIINSSNKKVILKMVNFLCDNTSFKDDFSNIGLNEKYKQIITYTEYLVNINYLIHNFLSITFFSIAIIYITYQLSTLLLASTFILVILLIILKWFKSKYSLKFNDNLKYKNFALNIMYQNLLNDYESITNKIGFKKWYEINQDKILFEKNNKIDKYISLEKIVSYLYYAFMVVIINNDSIDITQLLVMSNIVFMFSGQTEKILMSWLNVNKIDKDLLRFKIKKISKEIEIKNVVYEKQKVKENYVFVNDLSKVYIDYKKITTLIKEGYAYYSDTVLIKDEIISNNLFNFGNNNGIENFNKAKVYELLNKYNINLEQKASSLNEEQYKLIQLLSCLFTNKKIIIIKTLKYEWFDDVIQKIITNKTESLVVVVNE